MSDKKTAPAHVDAAAYIADCRKQIDQAMEALVFPPTPAMLYEPMRYVLARGGKRLRPLLTLLSYGLFCDDVRSILRPALAVELFHNFTLMHDDVMDQAPLRRGAPTVHARWDVNVAILAGDGLLINGYELLCEAPVETLHKVLSRFNESALRVCEGQQLDMDFEKKNHVTTAEYLEMIRLKTGCLLGFCLALGAVVAGANRQTVETLQALGEHLGLIFQLRDDLLDVYGRREAFGKRSGGDIASNKKTYLLITALAHANAHELKQLHHWLQMPSESDPSQKIAAVRSLYDQLKVRAATEAHIHRLRVECLERMKTLQLADERLAPLRMLIEALVDRNT